MQQKPSCPPAGRSPILGITASALAVAIFVVDAMTPLDIAVAVLYVIVVLVAADLLDRRGLLLVSAGCLTLTVLARQWEWRMRYPLKPDRFKYTESDTKDKTDKELRARAWAEIPEYDDVHVANELHCYKGANVKVYLRTLDVLHVVAFPGGHPGQEFRCRPRGGRTAPRTVNSGPVTLAGCGGAFLAIVALTQLVRRHRDPLVWTGLLLQLGDRER